MGLGQQVDLTVTVAVLQHGDVELADEPAGGQRLQLLLKADRQQRSNQGGGAVAWGSEKPVGSSVPAVGSEVDVAEVTHCVASSTPMVSSSVCTVAPHTLCQSVPWPSLVSERTSSRRWRFLLRFALAVAGVCYVV
jgi:hypothetical protein